VTTTRSHQRVLSVLSDAGLMRAPYVADGADVDRDGGLDCYGFVRAAMRALGITPELPERCAALLAVEPPPYVKVDRGEARAGDMVAMEVVDEAGSSHVALLVDRDDVAHTFSAAGRPRVDALSVLERLGFRVTGFYRMRGAER
jgi:cell wall-associated NlpC family hydrolase